MLSGSTVLPDQGYRNLQRFFITRDSAFLVRLAPAVFAAFGLSMFKVHSNPELYLDPGPGIALRRRVYRRGKEDLLLTGGEPDT